MNSLGERNGRATHDAERKSRTARAAKEDSDQVWASGLESSAGIGVDVVFLIEAKGLVTGPEDNTAHSTAQQERRYRRFKLRYPVHVEFRSGELVSQFDTVSRNVSGGGLLLEAPLLIPQGSSVSFVMILRGSQFIRPIELASEGEVVRVEPGGPEAGFRIAVKCTTPISQIQHFSSL